MNKELKYDIDNRDSNITWLKLENGDYVEVNVFELLENSIENNIEDEDKQIDLINLLYLIEEKMR